MRRNPDITLTIIAPPGAARGLVVHALGGRVSFQNDRVVYPPMPEGEVQQIIAILGREAGTDFDVVVESSQGGRRTTVRVTEARRTRKGKPVTPPRARGGRAHKVEAEPAETSGIEDDDPRGSGSDWWSWRGKSRTAADEARRQRYADEARRSQGESEEARRQRHAEEDRRAEEEARRREEAAGRRYTEERAREDARRRAEGEARYRQARAAYDSMPRSRSFDPKVIDRVKKLLRLATSSNAHEAAVAHERAAELMREHGIRATDIPDIWRRNLGRRYP